MIKNIYRQLFLMILISAAFIFFAFPWTEFGYKVPFSGDEYKLGLDLQGGIELDYKVDFSTADEDESFNQEKKNEIIEGLKTIIETRIQRLGINDSTIAGAKYGDETHIIVQIPLKGNSDLENSKNLENAKNAIGKVVKVEFKEKRTEITDADRQERKDIAQEAYENIAGSQFSFETEAQSYQDRYEKVAVGTAKKISDIYNFGEEFDTGVFDELEKNGGFPDSYAEITNKANKKGYLVYNYDLEKKMYNFLFIDAEPSSWKVALDSQGRALSDDYLNSATSRLSPETNRPEVVLNFDSTGAEIFGELTSRLVNQQIAIYVGGEQLTAPVVNSAILNGNAVVNGQADMQEANLLAQNINTGVVPAPIYLTSERTIDSRLGLDSLSKLLLAGFISFIGVFIFLLITYRVSGFFAGLALLIYILIILSILKLTGTVLTLAGIAGLILSLGIAIDSNIIIFERVKDELDKGNTLKNAVVVGFNDSFSAIWDANITGLIVSGILYLVGTNLIKGFGLVLFIGILVSLFTVYFISRVCILMLAETNISLTNFIGFNGEKAKVITKK